ncbi:MAG: 3'(2'),5'-bisphosphate nucleotidase CysQ [Congregibacter sp.]
MPDLISPVFGVVSGSGPLNDFLIRLLNLSVAASAIITEHYEDTSRSGLLRSKTDKTPLTEADLASHRMLSEGLGGLSPGTPILSEESDAGEIAGRRQWDRLWMLDPLDGTREFLDRTGEFTINIALIEAQRSVLGLVYQPMRKQGFLGIPGAGAWRVWRDSSGWQTESISTRVLRNDELVLCASHRHRNPRLDTTLAFLGESRALTRRNSGSALKFCDLAAGEGDCYPRFSPCSEWDVAAGEALVTAAGGAVLGLDGKPLRYNARDSLLSPHFIAIGDPDTSLWSDLLAKVQ